MDWSAKDSSARFRSMATAITNFFNFLNLILKYERVRFVSHPVSLGFGFGLGIFKISK
jgi:hypothetical protein